MHEAFTYKYRYKRHKKGLKMEKGRPPKRKFQGKRAMKKR